MKITFRKLIEASEAFRKLSQQELEVTKAVEVSRFIKKLENEYTLFRENYTKLIKKYGKIKNDKTGEYELDEKNAETFKEEVENLMNVECNIDGEKIVINDKIKLSAASVIALDDFIEFKE